MGMITIEFEGGTKHGETIEIAGRVRFPGLVQSLIFPAIANNRTPITAMQANRLILGVYKFDRWARDESFASGKTPTAIFRERSEYPVKSTLRSAEDSARIWDSEDPPLNL